MQIADCRFRFTSMYGIHRLTACSKIQSIPGKAPVNVHRTPYLRTLKMPQTINHQLSRPQGPPIMQLLSSTNGKILFAPALALTLPCPTLLPLRYGWLPWPQATPYSWCYLARALPQPYSAQGYLTVSSPSPALTLPSLVSAKGPPPHHTHTQTHHRAPAHTHNQPTPAPTSHTPRAIYPNQPTVPIYPNPPNLPTVTNLPKPTYTSTQTHLPKPTQSTQSHPSTHTHLPTVTHLPKPTYPSTQTHLPKLTQSTQPTHLPTVTHLPQMLRTYPQPITYARPTQPRRRST